MNKNEIIAMMATLREAYPGYYKDKTKDELMIAVNLWHKHFKDDDTKLVIAAVDAYVASDIKGFPPLIGQIKDKLNTLTQPEQMTEQEAWNLISKAMRNSTYHASEEFEKLPEILKQLVGGPSQLKEWALMEGKEVQTVVSSNLMRSYKVKAAKEKEYQSLPGDVKKLIENPSLMIEGGNG